MCVYTSYDIYRCIYYLLKETLRIMHSRINHLLESANTSSNKDEDSMLRELTSIKSTLEHIAKGQHNMCTLLVTTHRLVRMLSDVTPTGSHADIPVGVRNICERFQELIGEIFTHYTLYLYTNKNLYRMRHVLYIVCSM
jgi:hypothetical protein